jgi:hypothetical protein
MALSQAAALVEKVIGHGDTAVTDQDIANPGRDRKKYADPSGETMKALVWMGKNTVEVRKCSWGAKPETSDFYSRRRSKA